MRKIVLLAFLLGFMLIGTSMAAPSTSIAAKRQFNGPSVGGVPDHHYLVSGYLDEFWLSFNPDGTINGYDNAPGAYYAPILGMGTESRMLLFVDFPTGSGEELMMGIFFGLSGNSYFTLDGMTIDYVLYLTLVPAAGANTGGKALASAMQAEQPATSALKAFHLNPWIDIEYFMKVTLNEPVMGIGGYDDAPGYPGYPAPHLGVKTAKQLVWADDYLTSPGTYELRLNIVTLSSMDGNSYATVDGVTVDGPTYIWLTPA